MKTPSIFAVRAARASLDDRKFLQATRSRILASRSRITGVLTQLNLRYAEPQGNFIFFDTGMPLASFTQRMQARHLLVGTIGTEPEVDSFLRALRASLHG